MNKPFASASRAGEPQHLNNKQNMKPASPIKQSVLVPVRLGNNSSVITFDYKINRPYWPTPPNKLTLY